MGTVYLPKYVALFRNGSLAPFKYIMKTKLHNIVK